MYKKDHERRKPRPDMIYLVGDEFDLDLISPKLIEDKITDIQAGNNADTGVNIFYLDTRISNNNFDK